MRRVAWRIIPFLFLLYTFNYLDRLNVGIAALTMRHDLRLSEWDYGFGAGIFFLGYVLLEIPSNLLLERVGARLWMSRIVVSWGIISAATFLVRTPAAFYAMRFLLGIAEAGFFPGMVLYLTAWFPAAHRARASARFMVAGTFAGVIGGPIGGQLLRLNGAGGLHGWQWLFLVEGLPSVALGLCVPFWLTERPSGAVWLSAEERGWLVNASAQDRAARCRHGSSVLQGLRDRRVLQIAAAFFLMQLCGYSLGFWSPQILKLRSGWSDTWVASVGAAPGLVGAVAMLLAAVHSDRRDERKWHVAGGVLLGAIGMFLAACTGDPFLTLAAFSINGLGGGSANGPFWAMTSGLLGGAAAASGVALINSVGNMGGFVGPQLVGLLKQRTGGYGVALAVLALILCAAAVIAALLREGREQAPAGQAEAALGEA